MATGDTSQSKKILLQSCVVPEEAKG
jgi:hypothetical protein